MAAVFGSLVLIGSTIGGLTAYAGWSIHKRTHRPLIYIVAAFNCIFIPYGILFATFLVLSSPAARLEF